MPYTGKRHNTSQAKIDAFHKISTWSEWKHDMIFDFWIICTTWLISMNTLFDFWMICITWLVTPSTEHTVYQNRHQKYNQLTLDQFFYQVLVQSTFNVKNNDNSNDDHDENHVQDVLASNQHQLLVLKGMNCTPRYQVDYAYAQGMLIMHKPWNKHNTLERN